MFGIGTTEFLVILLVGVLVLGPEHLPRIMRTVTKIMSDFRKVSTDFQRTINLEAHKEEWEREFAAASTTKKKKKKKKAPVDESVVADELSAEHAPETPVDGAAADNASSSSPPDSTPVADAKDGASSGQEQGDAEASKKEPSSSEVQA